MYGLSAMRVLYWGAVQHVLARKYPAPASLLRTGKPFTTALGDTSYSWGWDYSTAPEGAQGAPAGGTGELVRIVRSRTKRTKRHALTRALSRPPR